MTWEEVGKSHLQAAKQTRKEFPRSSASRAYYAAHVVLTAAFVAAGYKPQAGRQTPPHLAQPRLIGQYLGGRGIAVVKELRSAVRRLYARRLDSDYKRTVTVDASLALDSVRDASTIFELLRVR